MKLKVLLKSSFAMLLEPARKLHVHAINMDKFMIKEMENMS